MGAWGAVRDVGPGLRSEAEAEVETETDAGVITRERTSTAPSFSRSMG